MVETRITYIRIPKGGREGYEEEFAPMLIEGVKVLVIIVSEAPAQNDYVALLKATYGRKNVDVHGCGQRTLVGPSGEGVNALPPPVTDEAAHYRDFTGYDYLSLYEFAELLRIISAAGYDYDQIHVLGHGALEAGILLRRGKFVSGKPSVKGPATEVGLEKALGGIDLPLKPGTKVLLIGCYTIAGPIPDYFRAIVGTNNVYAIGCDFECHGVNIPDKPPDGSEITKRYPIDWYHANQHPEVERIAIFLGISKRRIRPARPLRRLEVRVTGPHEAVEVQD